MKRVLRKFAVLLMTVVFLFGVVSAQPSVFAATPSISVEETQGYAGENVDVKISLKNNPGVTSVLLKITFDSSKLELIGVTDAGILGSQFHSNNYNSPYTLSWANDTATTNYTGNGTIATLRFRISSSLESNRTIPISVSYDYYNYDIIDKDLNKISCATTNGSVKVVNKNVAVQDVGLQKLSATLVVGESIVLNPIIYPSDATDKRVTWSSDNSNIATVDEYGNVRAVAPGSTYITVTTVSGGYQETCFVKVLPSENPECYGMYISSEGKTRYYIGDELDTSSMILYIDKDGRGLYNTKVTEGFTVSGFDSSTPGKKTLTVTYKGFTDTYEIEVHKLLGIEISRNPYTTTYFVNEDFDRDGLEITAYYTGGYSYKTEQNLTLSGFDSSTPGIKKITVEYKGKTASFTVDIKEALPLYMKQTISGDELIVSLNIKNAKGIGSGDLDLYYDDEIFTFMTLETSSRGKLDASEDVESDGSGIYGVDGDSYAVAVGSYRNGKRSVAFVFMSWSSINSDDFEICSIRFKINELNAGKQQIRVISKNTYIADASVSVNLNFEPEYILGDLDFDDSITSADARLALRASVNLEKLSELQFLAADADGDSAITSADARLILRASVGLESFS
ncbi:MAG: hypothetical protein E7573_09935 [Ruminococcaceae bacterium]|nr:hypothetical protein [Oscillospiraceae bacterium]MBR3595352.1 bacterial Ig-like domain-containing protein [Clostridia bacterium]